MAIYKEQSNEQISIQVEKYTQRIAYNGSGMPEYIGLSLPGASESGTIWQIRKLIYSGTNVTQILWAGGNNNFDNSWTNHSSLSYS